MKITPHNWIVLVNPYFLDIFLCFKILGGVFIGDWAIYTLLQDLATEGEGGTGK